MSYEVKSSTYPSIASIGQEPIGDSAVTRIPRDIWSLISSFTPDAQTMAALAGTNRELRALVNEERALYFKQIDSHPLLKDLAEKSRLFDGLSEDDYKRKIQALDQFLKFAKFIKTQLEGISINRQLAPPFFSDSTRFLRLRIESGIHLPPFHPRAILRDPLQSLSAQVDQLAYKDLFLCSVLKNDDAYFKRFDLRVIDKEYIDLAAYFALLKGDVAQFNQLLPFTTIFERDAVRSEEVLMTLIDLAIKQNRLDTLDLLIALRRPFDQNNVLVDAAARNQSGAIQHLLSSPVVFDKGFYPQIEMNIPDAVSVGLHFALMMAANKNNQEALQAILDALPGDAIDRRILEHVRDLQLNHEPVWRPPYRFNDWRDRELNPNRAGIAAFLNQEILLRFPPPEAVDQEQDGQFAPPVQAIVPRNQSEAQKDHRREIITAASVAALAILWQAASYYFSP